MLTEPPPVSKNRRGLFTWGRCAVFRQNAPLAPLKIKKLYQQAAARVRTEDFPAGLRHKRLKSAGIPARFFLAGQKIFSPIHAFRRLVQFLMVSRMEKSLRPVEQSCGEVQLPGGG